MACHLHGERNPVAKVQQQWVNKARALNKHGNGPVRIQAEFLKEGIHIPAGTIKGWLYSSYRATA